MSWIKIEKGLSKSTKVLRLAEVLRVRRAEALGLAMDWFCWLDDQCIDGKTGLTPHLLNTLMGHKKFSEGLRTIGWIEVDDGGEVLVVDFDQHNGKTAKARAMAARRVSNCKNQQKGNGVSVTEVTEKPEKGNGDTVTEVTEKTQKGNGVSVTKMEKERYLEKEYNSIDKGGRLSDATLVRDAEPAPTQAEDGFGRWLSAVAGAHPSAKLSRSLAADVADAARDAYKRCPAAEQEAELLGVYLASRHTLDRHGLAFYKPTGQRRFFQDLEDVIAHAHRWAREFSWKPKNAPKNAPKGGGAVASTPSAQKRAEGGKERQPEGMATDEQDVSFWSALRNGENWDG